MINLIIMAGFKNQTKDTHQECCFLKGILAISARRALQKEKIDSLEKLSDYTEKEILQFHGFGRNTVEKLKIYMKENDFAFRFEA
ncbi:DNA-directed RNA polymerase subunit alpha C-terminal domain-containing protein [Chryseobacterium sp.]|uniref:DNA-directed RNA polymerase subunit alpha C-terminal domain-containing protein n=1 Tax=Chryseobacterium sp. TaxID=1871047 RepID=UPI00289E1910|nr:DNA-directed RNA polymerase subunit alpha C-terminal domain-containing protein [Chryseobacterium sp.]